METIFLTPRIAKELTGKVISWKAPGYHKTYRGKCIIVNVDTNEFNCLTVEAISGDDLHFAFLEDFGLQINEKGTAYNIVDREIEDRCFTYSDDYREVEITNVEENNI